MKTSDFNYHLPEELIAQFPLKERSDSRLLYVKGSQVQDLKFKDIVDLLNPDDLLVFNNTKVIPARLFGQKSTGGKLEILIERIIDDTTALAHIRSSKSPKPGSEIQVGDEQILVLDRVDSLFKIKFSHSILQVLDQQGHMPLPPYITREDEESDLTRYQTLYGRVPGAVAAPTAGLHFDEATLNAIRDKGIESVEVTLHVGAGTFQPVRVENITDHHMHTEYVEVPENVVQRIHACKQRGGRVIAIGTTSVRSLETAARDGDLKAYAGDTDIFIYPGYEFKVIDVLITNFHLPESTLLMLVSALAGQENIMHAYQHAIDEKYRFFSYGDAMFIDPSSNNK